MVMDSPVVSGTFTYTRETNSIIEVADGTSANTLSGGTQMDGGFFQTTSPKTELLKTSAQLGASIAGVPRILVISLIPLTTNITVSVSFEWREP